jgi:CheY-like chemotaxis protein
MRSPHKQPALREGLSRAIVCDDDPIMRSLIKARLSGLVDEVVDVADGLDAWRLLSTETFHLALIDLMMPGLDGFALIQCVRGHRRTRHLPIVVLSSNDDKHSISRALAEGASSYLTKPLMWSVFSDHVEHIMRISYRAQAAEIELARYRQLTEAHANFAAAVADLQPLSPEKALKEIALLSELYADIATFESVNATARQLDALLDAARKKFLARSTMRQVVNRGLPTLELICSAGAIERVLVALLALADAKAQKATPLEMIARCTDDELVIRISAIPDEPVTTDDGLGQPEMQPLRLYATAHGGQIQCGAEAATYLLRLPRDRLIPASVFGRALDSRVA